MSLRAQSCHFISGKEPVYLLSHLCAALAVTLIILSRINVSIVAIFLFGKETFNLFVQLQYLIVSRLDITLNADMIHILFEPCHIDSLLETRYTHILACIFRCINTRSRLMNAIYAILSASSLASTPASKCAKNYICVSCHSQFAQWG